MGQIYNSDTIALSAGGNGNSSVTVDGISQDESGNIQINANSYSGTWKSGKIYRLNNIVSETVNGVPGLYVCLVESSTDEPSGGSNWRRMLDPSGRLISCEVAQAVSIRMTEHNKNIFSKMTSEEYTNKVNLMR